MEVLGYEKGGFVFLQMLHQLMCTSAQRTSTRRGLFLKKCVSVIDQVESLATKEEL